MAGRIIGAWVGVWLGAATLSAADVQGTIVIERKLTKRNVTATAGLYQRGVAVNLNADTGVNPIDYERSHVVVYLENAHLENTSGLAAKPVRIGPSVSPAAAVEHDALESSMERVMEQRDRRFVPDLLVVAAGESVTFPNFDPIFHNVFSLSKPKSFDLGNYPKGQTRRVTFPSPGVVFVYCHLHANMTAAIVVAPNRWSTIADASGDFALHDVPPGKYTAVAWHKAVGFFRQTVEVTAAEGGHARFVIPFTDATDAQAAHDAHAGRAAPCGDCAPPATASVRSR
jgi:plastocyanin